MRQSVYQPEIASLMDEARRRAEYAVPAQSQVQAGAAPINVSGAFKVERYTVNARPVATPTRQEFSSSGYKIVFKRQGSPTGARLEIEIGGLVEAFAPGDEIVGPFDRFSIIQSDDNNGTGDCLLVIVTDPRADFRQLALEQNSEGRTATVAQTASATTNVPTSDGDGIFVEGASKFLVILSAANAQTLSGGGTLVLHYFDRDLARWAVSPTVYTVSDAVTTAGVYRDAVFPVELPFPVGLIHVEARSVTTSGGDLTLTLRTVGS